MATNKLPAGSTWNRFVIENVTENQEIRVTFAPDANSDGIPDKYQTVVVTASADGSGTVDPSKKEIALGEDLTFTVTPGEGQALYQVKNGDEILYTNTSETPFSGTFTASNILADMKLTFVFSVDTDGDGIPDASETWYTITLNHDANTSIASNGVQDTVRVKIGQDCPIQFSALSGYAIDTVTIDDQSFVNNGQNDAPNGTSWDSITLKNIQKDHVVSVTGASTTDDSGVADKYKLKVTPVIVGDDGGEVTVDPVLVVYGHDVVATITPDENMSVDSIESGAETYVNNPNFGKAIIEDVEDVQEALEDPDVSEMILNGALPTTSEIQIDKPMTINGAGNTVTKSEPGKAFTMAADSTIKDITVENTADNTEWNSSYGVQFYTGEHTVKDSKFTGGNAGIIANSATVNLEGTIDVSGNTFGGIEVCRSQAEAKAKSDSNAALPAGVLNINGATIVNTTEEYGKPTIWIDGNTDEDGIVNGAEAFTMIQVPHGDHYQKQFYLHEVNSKPIVVGDKSYGSLSDAIAAANGAEISVKSDLTETFKIPAGVTAVINGNGHTLNGMITLDADGTNAKHGSLKISDMVFDGSATSAWSAIVCQDQSANAGKNTWELELIDCQINNFTKKGIYCTATNKVTLTGCTFSGCATAEMNDPNTYGDYVVDLNLVGVKDAEVSVDGCTFENNQAQKSSVKVGQRGGESDEGASDMPKGVTTSVKSFNVTECTFKDTVPGAHVMIGTNNKSEDTNPDAVNTTGAFESVSIANNATSVKVSTPYDGKTYTVAVGQTFTKTGSGDPVIA